VHDHEIFKKELKYVACHCHWGLLWWYTPHLQFHWICRFCILAAVLLLSLGFPLTNCVYTYSPNPGVGTNVFSSKHNRNYQSDSISLNYVCSCQYKYASCSSTSVSLGSFSVIGIACKGSGMCFIHAMRIFVNVSMFCVCFCTKYHFI